MSLAYLMCVIWSKNITFAVMQIKHYGMCIARHIDIRESVNSVYKNGTSHLSRNKLAF